MFTEQIKQLHEERQMPQRQLAEMLDIDTTTYCKIEKSERLARHEQIVKLAELFQTYENEPLSLWFASQIIELIENEKELAGKALKVAQLMY